MKEFFRKFGIIASNVSSKLTEKSLRFNLFIKVFVNPNFTQLDKDIALLLRGVDDNWWLDTISVSTVPNYIPEIRSMFITDWKLWVIDHL